MLRRGWRQHVDDVNASAARQDTIAILNSDTRCCDESQQRRCQTAPVLESLPSVPGPIAAARHQLAAGTRYEGIVDTFV